jgi:hypothetical protein
MTLRVRPNSHPIYDNINDARRKLEGTIVYYDGFPYNVRNVFPNRDDPACFMLRLTANIIDSVIDVKLVDPRLNFREYNLGFEQNQNGLIWWFRSPYRQYRQGLRRDQIGCLMPQINHPEASYIEFQYSRSLCNMLTNTYPTLQSVLKTIRDNPVVPMAFHQDFAVRWDRLHKGTVVVWRNVDVGVLNGSDRFDPLPEHKFLKETFDEAARRA